MVKSNVVQTSLFPAPQTPTQVGLSRANPASPFYGNPYPAETIALEVPYYLRRCRMALKEIAEAWPILLELGAAVPDLESRVYQRITDRYVQLAEASDS
jgi:hypothetical protein